jgi:hypothetical protein
VPDPPAKMIPFIKKRLIQPKATKLHRLKKIREEKGSK